VFRIMNFLGSQDGKPDKLAANRGILQNLANRCGDDVRDALPSKRVLKQISLTDSLLLLSLKESRDGKPNNPDKDKLAGRETHVSFSFANPRGSERTNVGLSIPTGCELGTANLLEFGPVKIDQLAPSWRPEMSPFEVRSQICLPKPRNRLM
jgi:hypothetical protein